MLVALLLIVGGIVLFDTRRRVMELEDRIIMIETEAQPAAAPGAPEPVRAEHAPAEEQPPFTPTAAARRSPWTETFAEPEVAAEPEVIGDEQIGEAAYVQPASGFEDLFGRRLPIWAGGVTLAVAGALLVKYSIDSGLLSPIIRVLLGLIFGAGLIGGAEVALRQEARVRDVRVRQALAGAGLATLYAVILAAANLYHLMGPGMAFAGLAGVTALAMGLSLRFGPPSAMLGLVGGLAAPALAGADEPNIPLLSCYLALTVGGLCALSRTQRWMWLGVGALIGGAGWGGLLLLSGALDLASSLSVGLFILALGIAFPLFAFSGSRATLIRMVSAVAASAQMAALIATGGFTLLHWALFGLLSAAFLWLSGREPALRRLMPVGLAVGLLLSGAWPAPAASSFAPVILGLVLIYGGGALWRLWRPAGGLIEAGQVAGAALGSLAVSALHFYRGSAADDLRFALMALVASALPALAMAMGWSNPAQRSDARAALLATGAAILLVLAGIFGLAGWTLPLVVGIVAVALLLLAAQAGNARIEWSGWAFAFTAVASLVSGGRGLDELGRLAGMGADAAPGIALLRWSGVALALTLFAWRARLAEGRLVAQIVGALCAYGAIAQVAPVLWLGPIAALGLPLLAEGARRLPPLRLLPALATLFLLTLLWAAEPLLAWVEPAVMSLLGRPLLVNLLPDMTDMLLHLALPAALIALALVRGKAAIGPIGRQLAAIVIGLFGTIALHILYRQAFAIADHAAFVRAGLAERTIWEGLLIMAGWAAWRRFNRRGVALTLLAAGIAHNLLYTLLLHNPLWAAQAVGSVPLFNLLAPAFAIPLAGLWLAGRIMPEPAERCARFRDGGFMVLILLFAFATLRQLFTGPMLNLRHLSAGEDIGRSVLAIILATGFLLWGIRRGGRDWRIASLLLMLGAVAKVFLLDASGLTGLLRIASFLALGFSLIGIGWLYSRHLRADTH
ncbi:DUF2339 domain-containing protein [Sphingobium amiense]|uniref:DUF2339 domain-containing protein n=1 Tax=Sphingobium amiense TaxID=135719 RepID=A0A494W2D7_9SPHN|nr:DUF2339 domain-containing protein [Sphingobium amiense]BBD98793.1 DUF2339 domain-containing protein [Sphingobium amiense]